MGEEVHTGRRRQREPEPVVHSITGAYSPHSDDLDARIKRYLWSMAVRTICVLLVIVVHNPVRWVFAVLAVILPGLAVVMANVAGRRIRRAVPPVTPTGVTQISLTPAPVIVSTGEPTATGRNRSAERPGHDSDERTA